MTDKSNPQLIVSAANGQADLVVGCEASYAVRAVDLYRVFLPSAKILARFDAAPPVTGWGTFDLSATGAGAPPMRSMVIRMQDHEGFAKSLGSSSKLLVRVDGSPPIDFAFDWSADTLGAFAVTAELAGADRPTAILGYHYLTQAIAQVAAGRDPNQIAALFSAMKLDWRDQGKPKDAAVLIGGIMNALSRTKNPRTVEDAGGVLFGAAWPKLRPLASSGDKAYREINQPMPAQLTWLADRCK